MGDIDPLCLPSRGLYTIMHLLQVLILMSKAKIPFNIIRNSKLNAL